MPRHAVFLLLSAGLCLASAKCSLSRRQITLSRGYLPRCKYDDHVIRNNELFSEKIETAQVVFTGKVAGEIVVVNSTLKFSVVVRRYFKNMLGLTRNKEVRILKTLNDGEGVKCRQLIRPKYTAIFIGRKLSQRLQDADLVLTISPVPVTLSNLDRVSAATKGNNNNNEYFC